MPANVIIQIRRGSASGWATNNPTLAQGELGYETDTGNFKIGTGTTAYLFSRLRRTHRSCTNPSIRELR